MKKVLSMVLALALVLTTLVVPMTVSAAVGDDTVTLSFVVRNADGGETIKRGENVEVDVIATPTNAETLQVTYYEFFVTYNGASLTYVNAESTISDTYFKNKDSKVYVMNDGVTVNLSKAGGTKLATLTFSVNGGATNGTQISSTPADAYFAYTSNTSYDDTEYTVVATPIEVPLEANTSSVIVDGTALVKGADARTFYAAAGVDVEIAATNYTSVTIDVPETAGVDVVYGAEDELAVYSASIEGAYTITVVLPEGNEVYKFNLVKQDIAATLAFEALEDTVYYAGESFTIPVTLAGLPGGAEAAMVTFNVDYDAERFDLAAAVNEEVVTTGQTVSVNEGAVSFGTQQGAVGINGGNFVNLTFTVKEDVALGDVTIKISAEEGKKAQIALVTAQVDPTETEVGVTNATQTVTLVLANVGGYIATEEGNDAYNQDVWAAEAYTYAITAIADPAVEIRYIKSAEALTECTETQFNSANALAIGGITVDEATDYYIVVKCGSDYQVIKALANGTGVFFDAGSPSIANADSANMTEWVGKGGTATIDLSQVAYNPSICEINKYEYILGEETVDYTSTPTQIVIEDCQENYTSMTIKITAENGKTAEATITLMIDATAPSIALTDGGQLNHVKTINIDVTNDETGASPIAAIDVYFNATALDGEITPDAITTGATLKKNLATDATSYAEADARGFYYFIVADEAGNKGCDVFEVTLEVLAAASDIQVESVDGKGSYETFKTQTEMEAIGIKNKSDAVITSNGTFTKLTITTDEAEDGYTNTFNLTKDGVDVEFTGTKAFAYDSEDEGNGAGKYILKVTTTNNNDAGDTLTDTYEFDIVAPADMISPDGNNTYNLRDYVKVQLLLLNQSPLNLPIKDIGFYGGLYSGDMNGDFTLTAEDANQLIQSRRALEDQGAYYTLDIMNQAAPVVE